MTDASFPLVSHTIKALDPVVPFTKTWLVSSSCTATCLAKQVKLVKIPGEGD